MFNIGAGETLLIALVLLIAVGPEQLPGLIRRAGRTMGQLRSMSEGLRRDFMSSMDELERASNPRKWADGGKESDARPAYLPIDRELSEANPQETGEETGGEPEAEADEDRADPTYSSSKIAVAPPFSSSADLEALKNGDGTAQDGDNPAGDDAHDHDEGSVGDTADDGAVDSADDGDGDTDGGTDADTTVDTGVDTDGDRSDVDDGGEFDDGEDRSHLTTDSGYDNLMTEDGPTVDDSGGGGTDTEGDRGVVS